VKISIIVPAYNEEKLVSATLRCIRDAQAAFIQLGWVSEVIVCDNNSTDRTAALARAEGAKVVFEPVNQISRARNRGAAAATGDWFIFVDADSEPSRALFADVAECICAGGCLAGGAMVNLDRPQRWAVFWNRVWNWISRTLKWMAGSFIFCEAAAFRELGGFSEELFVSEELEFSRRVKRLARRRGKQVVILARHPLVTSARKTHLYTPGEIRRFLWRAAITRGRARRDRSACAPWYDGRR
jgi:glycosyltransferase involved in cell wall biosynthesis